MIKGLLRRVFYAIYATDAVQECLSLYNSFLSRRQWPTRARNKITAGVTGPSRKEKIGQGLKAAYIGSRTHWNPEHPHFLCGIGRFQKEVFKYLEELGFATQFAGQEDRRYSREILQSDLIVTVPAVLPRIFGRINCTTVVFPHNTHVLVNNQRLIASSRKWGIPCEYFIKAPAILKGYQLADYVLIAENDLGVNNYVSRGIPLRKIKQFRNSLDHQVWVPSSSRRNIFTFVFWGSAVGLRKGLPALVAAWRAWYQGQNAELHIFGLPTSVSDLIFSGMREGNPTPGMFVHLRSYVAQDPEIIEFLGSSHVGVYPTLEDAQASSLLEMASCGLPIITTMESGVEFTPDFCYYVSADSVRPLKEAFQYWFDRPEQITECGGKARAHILEYHTRKVFQARFNEIMSEIALN